MIPLAGTALPAAFSVIDPATDQTLAENRGWTNTNNPINTRQNQRRNRGDSAASSREVSKKINSTDRNE